MATQIKCDICDKKDIKQYDSFGNNFYETFYMYNNKIKSTVKITVTHYDENKGDEPKDYHACEDCIYNFVRECKENKVHSNLEEKPKL